MASPLSGEVPLEKKLGAIDIVPETFCRAFDNSLSRRCQNEDSVERYPRCAYEPGISGHRSVQDTEASPNPGMTISQVFQGAHHLHKRRFVQASRSAVFELSTLVRLSIPPRPLPSASRKPSMHSLACRISIRFTAICSILSMMRTTSVLRLASCQPLSLSSKLSLVTMFVS